MFNGTGRGFFHLVFANTDDCFFTESYIKMNFESTVRMHLMEADFRQICFFDKTDIHNNYSYKLDFRGSRCPDFLSFLKKKKKFFLNKNPQNVDIKEYNGSDGLKRITAEFNFSALRDCMLYLLELMTRSWDIAIVCPIEVFAECCDAEVVIKRLAAAQAGSEHNIMVLTGSVNAADNDPYFRNPELEFNSKNEQLASNIFFNEKLFPDMIEKFNNSSASTPKLVLTYDALAETFADRMTVLNDLSFDKLRIAVRYVLMRNPETRFVYSPDAYAAVIWAWYENPGFRELYHQLQLPENPFLSTRIVTEFLEQGGFFRSANDVIHRESVWEYRKFLSRWKCEASGVSIVYNKTSLRAGRCYPIISFLTTFKKLISSRGERILGTEGMSQITLMTRYFSKPSYTSHHNKVMLPHERFADSNTKATVTTMYNYLMRKKDWNTWDDGAVLLLFTMFDQCYRLSKAMSSIDFYNELGKSLFDKGLQVLQYCMDKSEEYSESVIDSDIVSRFASSFISEAQQALSSGNNKKIKDFIVIEH